MTTTVKVFDDEAEESVIGSMLNEPQKIAEVVAAGLLPEDFYRAQHKLLYEAMVEAFYADQPVDPLTMSARVGMKIARAMDTDADTARKHVQEIALGNPMTSALLGHADVVRERASARRVLRLAERMKAEIEQGANPDEIAGRASNAALRIIAPDESTGELMTVEDAGRDFILELRNRVAMQEAGFDVGVKFDIPAIDEYTRGLGPTEVLIAGGEPGVGKSAVWWRAGMNNARRQLNYPGDHRMGTLIVSLEMGRHPSNQRVTQGLTGIDGAKLRTGELTPDEMAQITQAWKDVRNWPLVFNYAPKARASQLRALVSEAIRKHRVGLVIIDHFRMFDLDRRLQNKVDEDEEKARFLKEDLAGALNVAVICLAHTRKKDTITSDPRPKLSDLRGSGQIAAHSDFVCFLHRPIKHATQEQIDSHEVLATEAEMLWEKNRHGLEGKREFYFEPSTMRVV